MPTIRETIHVGAPQEQVWAFISDVKRCPEWLHFVRDVFDVSGGPVDEGTVYHERAKSGPFDSVSEWHITAFRPPARQTHVGRMPGMEMELQIELESEGSGTRWAHVVEFRFLPKLRPLGWLLGHLFVKRKMRADFRRALRSAKEILEREGEDGARERGEPAIAAEVAR
jgi:carbon monoxide dehydrogenase subunit G